MNEGLALFRRIDNLFIRVEQPVCLTDKDRGDDCPLLTWGEGGVEFLHLPFSCEKRIHPGVFAPGLHFFYRLSKGGCFREQLFELGESGDCCCHGTLGAV